MAHHLQKFSGERVCALKVSAWEYVEHVGVCIAFLPPKKSERGKSEKEEIVEREEERRVN